MIVRGTYANIRRLQMALTDAYGVEYRNQYDAFVLAHPIPTSIFGDPLQFMKERMKCFMLNFKNANGEIVMSEKDNGELLIHDEVLKESLENQMALEEVKKKVTSNDDKSNV